MLEQPCQLVNVQPVENVDTSPHFPCSHTKTANKKITNTEREMAFLYGVKEKKKKRWAKRNDSDKLVRGGGYGQYEEEIKKKRNNKSITPAAGISIKHYSNLFNVYHHGENTFRARWNLNIIRDNFNV